MNGVEEILFINKTQPALGDNYNDVGTYRCTAGGPNANLESSFPNIREFTDVTLNVQGI